MSSSIDNWQYQRQLLNHDWLQNLYCPRLVALRNVTESDQFSDSVLEDVSFVTVWPQQSTKFSNLISTAVESLSPRNILCDWHEHPSCVVREVVHLLWLFRSSVVPCANFAEKMLKTTDIAYSKLSNHVEGKTQMPISDLRGVVAELDEFLIACRELSKSISRFPNSIKLRNAS